MSFRRCSHHLLVLQASQGPREIFSRCGPSHVTIRGIDVIHRDGISFAVLLKPSGDNEILFGFIARFLVSANARSDGPVFKSSSRTCGSRYRFGRMPRARVARGETATTEVGDSSGWITSTSSCNGSRVAVSAGPGAEIIRFGACAGRSASEIAWVICANSPSCNSASSMTKRGHGDHTAALSGSRRPCH